MVLFLIRISSAFHQWEVLSIRIFWVKKVIRKNVWVVVFYENSAKIATILTLKSGIFACFTFAMKSNRENKIDWPWCYSSSEFHQLFNERFCQFVSFGEKKVISKNVWGFKCCFSKFVLKPMESKKYAFFKNNHKIRSLIDMDLISFLNVRHILVVS